MQYRRARIPGARSFFPVVTYKRQPILNTTPKIDILRQAFRKVRLQHPFIINAIVVLPDHLHCIWTLPVGDQDYSNRWRLIKTYFTRACARLCWQERNTSRVCKQEQTVWQRRFWEHVIRNDRDYTRHVEYIHYNPVRHGLAGAPNAWRHSILHTFVKRGLYDENWGSGTEIAIAETVGRG